MHNFRNDFEIHEVCSCGNAVDQCLVWKETFKKFKAKPHSIDSISIFKTLSENADENVIYLCDASKSTWGTMLRPLQLERKYDIFVIHLVRNGESCLSSVLKRRVDTKNVLGMYFRIFSTAIHWFMANLAAFLFRIYKPDRYKFIKYEDLIIKPLESLKSLFDYLNLDHKAVFELLENNGGKIPLTHQLSGTAIRRTEDLQLTSKLKNPHLPYMQKLFFRIIAFPVLKMKGY